MGAYLGSKFHTFAIEAATRPLEMYYMGAYLGVGACPRHYGTCMGVCIMCVHVICEYIHVRHPTLRKGGRAPIASIQLLTSQTRLYGKLYNLIILWNHLRILVASYQDIVFIPSSASSPYVLTGAKLTHKRALTMQSPGCYSSVNYYT